MRSIINCARWIFKTIGKEDVLLSIIVIGTCYLFKYEFDQSNTKSIIRFQKHLINGMV